jgi:hypothetical protein
MSPMTLLKSWPDQFLAELKQAKIARQSENEGMARVCARRAVGILLEEYLLRHGYTLPGSSANDRLVFILTLPDLSPEMHVITQHFLLRVTPEHTLPINVDLIAEADWLAVHLLESPNENRPTQLSL